MCWNNQRKKEKAITNLFIELMTLAKCSCPNSNKGRVTELELKELKSVSFHSFVSSSTHTLSWPPQSRMIMSEMLVYTSMKIVQWCLPYRFFQFLSNLEFFHFACLFYISREDQSWLLFLPLWFFSSMFLKQNADLSKTSKTKKKQTYCHFIYDVKMCAN